eukprot:355623-Chlamydomonas_euryale.AAC.7
MEKACTRALTGSLRTSATSKAAESLTRFLVPPRMAAAAVLRLLPRLHASALRLKCSWTRGATCRAWVWNGARACGCMHCISSGSMVCATGLC